MKQAIRKLIEQAVLQQYPEERDLHFAVDAAPANITADFASNAAMILAKRVGKKPIEIAEQLAGALKADQRFLVSAALPGFLNFQVSDHLLFENLAAVAKAQDKFGQSKIGGGNLAIVEYFQLNVAKPPHVGHLRSAVIGDSLKRILKYVGYKTVSDTHVGDWGTQFGVMLWALKTPRIKDRGRVKLSDLAQLNKLYVEANQLIASEPVLLEEAKREFVLLEQGDAQNRKAWQSMVKASLKELHAISKKLELEKFDYELGESFYEKHMKAIISKLEKSGLLKKGQTGEKYIDLDEYGLGRLIAIKSDGGTTYELRDLATLAYRYDTLAKDEKAELAWNLYIVDARQSHDLKQVMKAMELLGYDVSRSRHIAFGFMSLPEGALSTRKGNVIHLEKLIEEAVLRAKKIIEEKNPELAGKDKVAEAVGLAALKYFDLKHNRSSDIVFRWEDVLAFEGNTGPYLQYTHARLRSILRKSKLGKSWKADHIELAAEERAVLVKLAQFEDAVLDAAADFLPNVLAHYLYGLAEAVNSFYHAIPVLQEKDEKKKNFRLNLASASAQVLKNGLKLLGISAPEEM